MVDGDLFDKLSKIGSILRKKPDRPFGGIQVSSVMRCEILVLYVDHRLIVLRRSS